MKKKNKKTTNTTSTAAEYAAVKTAKALVAAVDYQQEEELDALVQAHPALNAISASEIVCVIAASGSWSRADVMEEISFLASKVRKVNFLLGTAVMVVLESGVWCEVYPDGIDWHFGMPTTAECCREMHAARKRQHANGCTVDLPLYSEWDG